MSTDRHIDTNRLDQVYKDMETAREQAKSINDLKNAITKARYRYVRAFELYNGGLLAYTDLKRVEVERDRLIKKGESLGVKN